MNLPSNQTIFSGIQPSGSLHLGNYLGALKNWVALQDHNSAYYCIVDLHAITSSYQPDQLHSRVLDTAAIYLAAGLDPDRSTLFIQSHVPTHTELAWLLSTQTSYGQLARMTQFKEKSQSSQETTLGLFAYPVLQVADILLYQPDIVPVGEDQKQHLELARDLAEKLNNKFNTNFPLPELFTDQTGARIMSLQHPDQKMSKSSDDLKGTIYLTDDSSTIQKKISSAQTDTQTLFSFEHSGPAVKNLLNIYQAISQESQTDIEDEFKDSNYQTFKAELADLLTNYFSSFQDKYYQFREDEDHLRLLLARGAEKARVTSNQTLISIKEKMGLI